MIVGIGVDLCAIDRFATACARPGFIERVFTPAEREGNAATLAGRFAVKEAVAKALGAPAGLSWHECEVTHEASGRPTVALRGQVKAVADALGVRSVWVSISHDAGASVAMVVCES